MIALWLTSLGCHLQLNYPHHLALTQSSPLSLRLSPSLSSLPVFVAAERLPLYLLLLLLLRWLALVALSAAMMATWAAMVCDRLKGQYDVQILAFLSRANQPDLGMKVVWSSSGSDRLFFPVFQDKRAAWRLLAAGFKASPSAAKKEGA